MSDILERARKYLAKVPPAVAGSGGHNQTFYAACRVVKGFNLTFDEAMTVLGEWNATCVPPWSTHDLAHKINDALKAEGETGFLLDAERTDTEPKPSLPPPVTASPAEDLRKLLDDAIQGRRYPVPFPWPMLTSMSNALLPGTITVLSAGYGSAKSFFIIEAALFWLKLGVQFKLLELEDDRAFHTRRAMAQLADNSNLTDDNYCRSMTAQVKEAWEKHADTLEALGQNIREAPDRIGVDDLLGWLRLEAPRNRVIVIDPITAKEPSNKPWVDDQYFVMAAKGIIKNLVCSLILVTHPPKGFASIKKVEQPDDVAGGAAFLRFTHTVISIYSMAHPESRKVSVGGERVDAVINRSIVMKKTRNGKGQGASIGFMFDPKNLRHYERGLLV